MNMYLHDYLCIILIVHIHVHTFVMPFSVSFPSVDFSRVILNTIEGVEGSDYINASYMDVRKLHSNTLEPCC